RNKDRDVTTQGVLRGHVAVLDSRARPRELRLSENLVEEGLRLVLGALLGERNLADEDVPSLGEHALLTSRQAPLALATPEVTHNLCHLERVSGGQLLKIRLVTPRPVGRFLGVWGAKD